MPNLDGRVRTTPGELSAIRAEGQAFHASGGIAQVLPLRFPRLRIPEFDGAVCAGRGQKLSIRAECDARGATRVRPRECEDAPPGRQVPALYRVIGAAGDG